MSSSPSSLPTLLHVRSDGVHSIHPAWLQEQGDERGSVLLDGGAVRALAPQLPMDTRGVWRVDDRRVISGIVHVLSSGGRWIDAPAVYGPCKTLYNRFVP